MHRFTQNMLTSRTRLWYNVYALTLMGLVPSTKHFPCISSIAVQACEDLENFTNATPLDSFVCLSFTNHISWISPKGEKWSRILSSVIDLLVTKNNLLFGGSSRYEDGLVLSSILNQPAQLFLRSGNNINPTKMSLEIKGLYDFCQISLNSGSMQAKRSENTKLEFKELT